MNVSNVTKDERGIGRTLAPGTCTTDEMGWFYLKVDLD
jgi:hypothetical protein